ncbi:acyltransferase family protein [Altibacter sp. HG106]|uniref:acyltransferase family protein n=1 Tax=Altibacter sp. HG106 TaxID=3023937 RepID=UPI00234FE6B2|nr:acyltransferase [Altibacter sp. HG106]MDC7995382.1 acyltransferase [Altibacter sp. HG106]
MKRLPNLDVLRFLLATMVLIYHVPKLCESQGLPYFNDAPIFQRGIEAVYMFFVLSGFLIIRLIYRAKQNGTFSISNFYMRRILRIFPLYYLVLFFGFFFYWIALPALGIAYDSNYPFWKALGLSVFFFPNISASLYEPGGILEILWSIGIEEQFYLLVAPLLFLIRTKRILIVLTALVGIYLLLFHWEAFYLLRKYQMVYFYLFGGGIIALMEAQGRLQFLKSSLWIPLSICVATLVYFTTDWLLLPTYQGKHVLTVVLFCLFVHTAAHNHRNVIISNPLLNYFGNISYGIYMYHAIVLNFVVYLFLKGEWAAQLGAVAAIILTQFSTLVITLIVAHVSYRYVETYFLNLKSKFRK